MEERATGWVTSIANALPFPSASHRWYRIDPHPQSSPGDHWVANTAEVRSMVDAALCSADPFCG